MGSRYSANQQENDLTDKIEKKLQQIREWEKDETAGDVSVLYVELERLLHEVNKLRATAKAQTAGRSGVFFKTV
ncbi:hypothetical protein [Sporomusa termitida]|uniref:Uncharacterized protein n=1 Tax=Sporomusa termitida TaxID=2377 RepID=A0A517E0U8_9FIRM|nr:hypothetical protein [Sporomusa termitida]QDR83237.1 hypothetical protein SPTER_47190 [Sporomusa termitida]